MLTSWRAVEDSVLAGLLLGLLLRLVLVARGGRGRRGVVLLDVAVPEPEVQVLRPLLLGLRLRQRGLAVLDRLAERLDGVSVGLALLLLLGLLLGLVLVAGRRRRRGIVGL